MKKNRFLYILLIILFIAMISLNVLKSNNNNENNKLSDITISNITFKDISYNYDKVNNNTTFELKIVNNNTNSVRLNKYAVLIYDENNNLIDIYSFNSSYVLNDGGVSTAGFVVDMEYKDNYIIKIELPEMEIINNDMEGYIDVS